jgi:hypothetical protein
MFSLICGSQEVNIIEERNGIVITRDWEGLRMRETFNKGHQDRVREEELVLVFL